MATSEADAMAQSHIDRDADAILEAPGDGIDGIVEALRKRPRPERTVQPTGRVILHPAEVPARGLD